MTESCPTCGAQVMFVTNVCPNCQIDRVHPDPAKLARWQELTAEAKTKPTDPEQRKKRRKNRYLAWRLGFGGFLILWMVKGMIEIFKPEGLPLGLILGFLLGVSMFAAGLIIFIGDLLKGGE